MHRFAIIATLFFASCATPTEGEDWNPTQGDKVVQAFVRYQYADNGGSNAIDQEGVTIDTDVGYFVSDRHEFGLTLDGLWTRTETSEGSLVAFGPFYNFNYPLSPKATLYVGPEILLQRFDSDDEGFDSQNEIGYGGRVGVRFWFTPSVSFIIEPSYLFTDYDEELGGEQDLFRVRYGIAIRF